MLQFFLLSVLFLTCFLLVPLDHYENLLNSGILPNMAYNLNTDYLASGWLFCFILQTEYVLKFVYSLLVLIECSKSLWISGKASDITISVNYTNLVNGELIIHSNIMQIYLKFLENMSLVFCDMNSVTNHQNGTYFNLFKYIDIKMVFNCLFRF